jgi:hypothetical protein
MYKDLLKNPAFYEIKYPQTIVPNPTDADYQLGFIKRYFVRKANDAAGHIFEISEETYTEYVYGNNPFWIIADLKWRITGPKTETLRNDGTVDIGIINANKNSIGIASQKLRNLKLYLPNLLQFYKG